MSDSLNVIIVDDEPWICEVLTEIVTQFYAWARSGPLRIQMRRLPIAGISERG